MYIPCNGYMFLNNIYVICLVGPRRLAPLLRHVGGVFTTKKKMLKRIPYREDSLAWILLSILGT